jgi:hypothetical protein
VVISSRVTSRPEAYSSTWTQPSAEWSKPHKAHTVALCATTVAQRCAPHRRWTTNDARCPVCVHTYGNCTGQQELMSPEQTAYSAPLQCSGCHVEANTTRASTSSTYIDGLAVSTYI